MKRFDASPGRRQVSRQGAGSDLGPAPDNSGTEAADRPPVSMIELSETLGVTISDSPLLVHALVHRSAVNEQAELRAIGSNERLEFLGDSVLDFVISEHLYAVLPEAPEGTLTDMRAAIVREEVLAAVASRLDLGRHLLLGRGEAESGGRARPRLLASAFEAIVGAVYLDRGLDVARELLLRMLHERVAEVVAGRQPKDAKSRLQEASQARTGIAPEYVLVSTTGPSHAPQFEVSVAVGGQVLGSGSGPSKQDAEEAAARAALTRWDSLDTRSTGDSSSSDA